MAGSVPDPLPARVNRKEPVCSPTACRPSPAAAARPCHIGKPSQVSRPSGTPGRFSFRCSRTAGSNEVTSKGLRRASAASTGSSSPPVRRAGASTASSRMVLTSTSTPTVTGRASKTSRSRGSPQASAVCSTTKSPPGVTGSCRSTSSSSAVRCTSISTQEIPARTAASIESTVFSTTTRPSTTALPAAASPPPVTPSITPPVTLWVTLSVGGAAAADRPIAATPLTGTEPEPEPRCPMMVGLEVKITRFSRRDVSGGTRCGRRYAVVAREVRAAGARPDVRRWPRPSGE